MDNLKLEKRKVRTLIKDIIFAMEDLGYSADDSGERLKEFGNIFATVENGIHTPTGEKFSDIIDDCCQQIKRMMDEGV